MIISEKFTVASILIIMMLIVGIGINKRNQAPELEAQVQNMKEERDYARLQWCWLMDVEGLGSNSDGSWTGSLTLGEDRKQYEDWCTKIPTPAEWYGVEHLLDRAEKGIR